MTPETFRLEVGSLDCLAVSDGTHPLDARMLFANAPAHELEHALQRG